VSNLRRFLRRQWDLLVECVLRLDGLLEVLESGMTGSRGGGGLGQGLFEHLELYGCHQSVGHLTALLIAVIGCLTSPVMEMTLHCPSIFSTK
jgi:hypothetical protein